MESIIILMGPTGAGKSYQAEVLAKQRGWIHLSSGDLLRQDPALHQIMDQGELVPSSNVDQVVMAAIQAVSPNKVIVLDGYPRVMDEVAWLEDQLTQLGRQIERVVLLEVSEGAVAERLRLRQRTDDTAAAVREKLAEYHTVTGPVIAHFESTGVLVRVNGNGTPEAVTKALEAIL